MRLLHVRYHNLALFAVAVQIIASDKDLHLWWLMASEWLSASNVHPVAIPVFAQTFAQRQQTIFRLRCNLFQIFFLCERIFRTSL